MRLPIFWRLVLSSSAIVALMAAVNIYALSQVRQLSALSTQLVADHYPAIENAQLLITTLYSQFRSQKQYLAVRDAVFLKNFEDEAEQFHQIFAKLQAQESSADGRKILRAVRKRYEEYQLLFRGIMNRRAKPVEPFQEIRREGLIDDMTVRLQKYINLHEIKISAVMTEARGRSAYTENITSRLGLVTLFLALGLAGLTTYSILRPLRRLQEQFQQIGLGNFSRDVDISGPRDLRGLVETANWMRTKLQELDDMKSDFLAHISHELRTPLASMREGTHLLLDEIPGTLSNDQRQILRIMNDSSQRLMHLISTLLDLAKMEAGMMEYKIVPTELKGVAHGSIHKVQLLAESKHVQILLDFPPGQLWVPMDGASVEQVFDNLVSNALKFAPIGGTLKVQLTQDSKKNVVAVSVSDTGPGIPPEDLPHVFDRFYQGKQSGKSQKGSPLGGSGLGLALAKTIVEAHGGRITMESELGKGTTVHFELPLGTPSE
jgi:two-component system, NtrC family, sensor histidine kinase GlrK